MTVPDTVRTAAEQGMWTVRDGFAWVSGTVTKGARPGNRGYSARGASRAIASVRPGGALLRDRAGRDDPACRRLLGPRRAADLGRCARARALRVHGLVRG